MGTPLLKVGDKIRVVKPGSSFFGQKGEVTYIDPETDKVVFKLDKAKFRFSYPADVLVKL